MTTQQLLDDRYGRTHGRRRRVWWWTIVGTLAVTVVGWLIWTTASSAARSVDAEASSSRVVNAHQVSITFQITTPAGSGAACVLEADDSLHGVVGWRVVEYPASADRRQEFTEMIPTVGRAQTGLVNACWVP